MSFNNRREYLFVYSVKDANPNGDPLAANNPRYDDENGVVLVSDVRIKRTVRDQWLREGKSVFVDGEAKTLKQRIEELKKEHNAQTGKDTLSHFLDTRLFGVTFALDKESFSWTGPVQFKWGRSIHKAGVMMVQGTAAFATKESSEQRSFRSEYIVPFALIADYGIANQYSSQKTGATDEDLEALFDALWKGTYNLITRSKIGHTPRFLVEIKYIAGFNGAIGAMDEKIALKGVNKETLSSDEQMAIRSCEGVTLDITKLYQALVRVGDSIESVRVIKDADLSVSDLDEVKSLLGGRLTIEER